MNVEKFTIKFGILRIRAKDTLMTDEQCIELLDKLDCIVRAIHCAGKSISDAIDGIYCADNEGIEKRLDKLMEVLYDCAGK